MVQSAGRISPKPYYIKEIGINVWSLEEINYYVYNHMDLVYASFFSEELFAFLEDGLGERALALELREIEKNGASVQDFISCLFKESGYYSAPELAEVSAFVMGMDLITPPERLKVGADKLFLREKYIQAKTAYLEILEGRKTEENPASDTFYAGVAFSVGLCYARLFLCRNAIEYFNMAYGIFPKADYAKAAVYMSIASGDDEELLKAIIRYKISDDALEKIKTNVEDIRTEILESEDFEEFSCNMDDPEKALSMAQTYKDEYYRMTEEE